MSIHEVSEDKKSLISGYEPEGEGPDAADIGEDNVPVLIEKDGKLQQDSHPKRAAVTRFRRKEQV